MAVSVILGKSLNSSSSFSMNSLSESLRCSETFVGSSPTLVWNFCIFGPQKSVYLDKKSLPAIELID